ncbi:DUF5693 family protein [Paenibacillus caui]|uniref:DUF5693 family protein n=1 Tax=Paenibacillus caui TaxID=2873927 RepID=UPI001CA7F051|nr:DUF5693 family protein [Paenibacillus caui]
MKERTIWILTALMLVCSVASFVHRSAGEQQERRVELAVPYTEIAETAGSKEVAGLLQFGVSALVLKETNLGELESRKLVKSFSGKLPSGNYALPSGFRYNAGDTLVLSLSEDKEDAAFYLHLLESAFKDNITAYSLDHGGWAAVIHMPKAKAEAAVLGVDTRQAGQLRQRYGAQIIPAYTNAALYRDGDFLDKQFRELAALGIRQIYFGAGEALGYPDLVSQTARLLKKHNLHFTLIRSQAGALQLAKETGYREIRPIFIDPSRLIRMSVKDAADLFELSVRERGISMIYFPMPKNGSAEPAVYLKKAGQVTEELASRLAPAYSIGEAAPISSVTGGSVFSGKPYKLFPLIGITLLAALLLRQFTASRALSAALLLLGAAGIAAGYIKPSLFPLIQSGYGLIGGIAAPSLAVIAARSVAGRLHSSGRAVRRPLLHTCLAYAMGAAITLGGVIFVAALFNDIAYLAYVEQFRGVKLLFAGPVAVVLLFLWLKGDLQAPWYSIRDTFVRPWQARRFIGLAVILLLVLVGAVYFITRSGNEGTMLPYEARFRQLLDHLFGVRPRTKEILLGHPVFVAAIYALIRSGKGAFLMAAAVIGQLSMLNTFTHLHSPLAVSLERTMWGLAVGLLLGGLLTLLIQGWIRKTVHK